MTENKNILEGHHLKKSFTTGKKSFTAVEDISFSLKKGEVLGIVGESGSGKSTVAKMITHLTEPTAGEIFLMEKNITQGEKISGKSTGKCRWFFRHRQNPLIPDALLGTESGKVSGIWG